MARHEEVINRDFAKKETEKRTRLEINSVEKQKIMCVNFNVYCSINRHDAFQTDVNRLNDLIFRLSIAKILSKMRWLRIDRSCAR